MNDDGFRIDTPEQASWAMRKYRALAQKRQRQIDLAAAEHERIEAWQVRVLTPINSQMEFYAAHLEGYAMKERAKGNKTMDFPDGSIKTRQTGISYEVDRARFIEWAEQSKRDDLLRITLAPDLPAIKAAVVTDQGQVLDPSTGEVIPGLMPLPERVSVKIEPDLTAADLDEEEFDDSDE